MTAPKRPPTKPSHRLLRTPAFRAFLLANALERLASSALTVLLGFQVYTLTRDPLMLGWLGLAEAAPAIGLVLLGGHVADRRPRRRIVLLGTAGLALLAASLAAASGSGQALPVLFAAAVLTGAINAFAEPALSGLEAHAVPLSALVPGLALLATTGRLATMLGPLAGGLAWATLGPAATYATLTLLFAASAAVLWAGVPEAPIPDGPAHANAWRSIREGVAFVFRSEVLLGSMALDLFAVFFGGATALLPIFATDILHVGPAGFGLLRSAGAAGSLAAALLAARFLPQRRAGWALHGVIAGFGVCMIVFGLSRSLPLSLAALFTAGLCDGTSVVIRRAILRLAAPDAMRGRVAAVKSVFVGSSNELGAFESGVAASVFGASAAVWGGGLVTLGVVAVVAWRAPMLLRLNLEAVRHAAPNQEVRSSTIALRSDL